MSLETGNYISNLNPTNPTGADPKSQGDDHLRLIKAVLQNCFAGFTGAVMVTGTDGGVLNAYTVTATPAVIAYTNRMMVMFSPLITNTGAATININGLGAKSIKSVSGADVVANDLIPGALYVGIYDGVNFRLHTITKNYADQLAFNTTLPAQAGNDYKFLRTQGGSAAWFTTGYRRETRNSNTILTNDDDKKQIDFTGGLLTQTFSPTLYSSWNIILRNSTVNQPIELEPIAAVTTTSSTIATAASTSFVVGTGLAISIGDFVAVRRTSKRYTQRIIGTVASYNSGSGALTITVTYFINQDPTAPVTISTMTNVGTLATVTTLTPHNLNTGDAVTTTGATPTAYNGTFIITVLNPTQFTYVMASDPGGSAAPVATYTVSYTDWTVTTRSNTAGIDGLPSLVMYPQEARLITWDGTKLTSIVLTPYLYSIITTETIVGPSGYAQSEVDLVGGGGGGGSGSRQAAGAVTAGGCPGGTPGHFQRRAILVAGNPYTASVGAAGVGGAAILVNSTNGAAGTAGGNSTFNGNTAFGGVAGPGGTSANTSVSGSGSLSAGASTSAAASGGSPVVPGLLGDSASSSSLNNIMEGGAAIINAGNTQNGANTEWGGAASTSIDTSTVTLPTLGAGSSIRGVPAGTQGGWITAANTTPATAPRAGQRASYISGGGAIGGTCGGSPTAGANGATAADTSEVGASGAGGGSSTTVAAANGGNGGFPGGSGGGGGASRNGQNSGAGGNGAGGRIVLRGIA